tara:strand:- start:143 stop:313 length:171 start_codon:yes stop_codon:yes gene_type:complete
MYVVAGVGVGVGVGVGIVAHFPDEDLNEVSALQSAHRASASCSSFLSSSHLLFSFL